jgi:hypothetical protein
MIFEILECAVKGDGWKVVTAKEAIEGRRKQKPKTSKRRRPIKTLPS